MKSPASHRYGEFRRSFTSFLIVAVLALQLQAFVPSGIGLTLGVWAWPFIDYPMYTTARPPGPVEVAKVRIYLVAANGELTEVTSGHFDRLGATAGHMFQREYRGPLIRGDTDAARRLAAALAPRHREFPFTAVLLETVDYELDGSKLRQTGQSKELLELIPIEPR